MQRIFGAIVLSLSLAAPVATASGSDGGGVSLNVGLFPVRVGSSPFRLEVDSPATGLPILASRPGLAFCRSAAGTPAVRSRFGLFHFDDRIAGAMIAWEVTEIHRAGTALRLQVALRPSPEEPASGSLTLTMNQAQEGVLQIGVETHVPGHNRLLFAFPSPGDESFLGFGEQYNRIRHEGHRVPIWTSEQGIGRTDGPIHLPFTGTTTDTYFPIPCAPGQAWDRRK